MMTMTSAGATSYPDTFNYLDFIRNHQEPFDAAVAIVMHRRVQDSPLKRQMMEIAQRYNADYTIPLSDVEGEPEFPALSAAIIADAIDSSSTRSNDTSPGLFVPPLRPNIDSSKERAHLRRRAWASTWAGSQLPLRLGRLYRQYFGYGTFCMMAVPDHEAHRARIVTRDVLNAYPEPMGTDEVRCPGNIGFVYGRSPQWLMRQYPEAREHIRRQTSTDDDLFDVLEWIDNEWIYVGIMGKRAQEDYQRRYRADGTVWYETGYGSPNQGAMLLRAYPNRAGMVPGVCPSAVTLDRTVSSLRRIVPIVDLMNKIAALDFLAAERGVFPDRYAIGDQSTMPKIVGGQWRDGRTGQMNLLENVKAVGELQSAPGPATQQLMSTLERNARVSSGNPAVFQGEMSGSVRSGQTISQLGAFSVDPRIKEAHLTMQYALEHVNQGVAAIEEGYWPRQQFTVFSGWQGDNSHVTYVPEEIWAESKANVVAYPMPGMDVNNATIALAQAVGSKMMSRGSARNRHPLVDNPEVEETQMMVELLDDALNMAALQQVQAGQMPLTDLVAIRTAVANGEDIALAMAKVHEAAQKRQAEAAPPAGPGELAPPGAQPGINDPNAGGQNPVSPEAIANTSAKAGVFNQILQNLKSRPPGAAGSAPTSAPPTLR